MIEGDNTSLRRNSLFEIGLFFILYILIFLNSTFEGLDIQFFNDVIKASLGFLVLLLLLKINRYYFLFHLVISIVLFIFDAMYVLKIINFLPVLYISYKLAFKYALLIRKFLIIVLSLNAIFILIEINGLIPELAFYQNYYNPTSYESSLFTENSWFPLFQIRPSGIFHTTIYLSFEIIFIMAILIYPVKNDFTIVVITFISIFSGATALFLSVFVLIVMAKHVNSTKYIVKVFIFMVFWLLLYYFLYPAFFSYNFSADSFVSSILSRFDLASGNSTYTGNSILAQVIIIFAMLILLIFYLIVNLFRFKLKYVYILTVIFIILTVHNFINSFKLYLNIGLLLGFISSYHLGLVKIVLPVKLIKNKL
jgi:hypothetical protein